MSHSQSEQPKKAKNKNKNKIKLWPSWMIYPIIPESRGWQKTKANSWNMLKLDRVRAYFSEQEYTWTRVTMGWQVYEYSEQYTHTQTSQTPSSVVDDTSALLVYYYCVLLHTIYDVNGWIPTWKISMNQPTCDNKIIDLSQRHISNEHFCDSQSRISPFSHCGRVFLN